MDQYAIHVTKNHSIMHYIGTPKPRTDMIITNETNNVFKDVFYNGNIELGVILVNEMDIKIIIQ